MFGARDGTSAAKKQMQHDEQGQFRGPLAFDSGTSMTSDVTWGLGCECQIMSQKVKKCGERTERTRAQAQSHTRSHGAYEVGPSSPPPPPPAPPAFPMAHMRHVHGDPCLNPNKVNPGKNLRAIARGG